MTTNNKHPKAIQLTSGEQEELDALVLRAGSPMSFWLRCYASRGIEFRTKLPVATPTAISGEFQLSWTERPLGPEAIRQGKAFRKFQEEKEQKFDQKLQRSGRPSW